MRKVLVLALVLGVGLALAAPVHAQSFSATLNGSNVTVPTGSGSTGTGSFTYDAVTKMLSYNITFSPLDAPETVSHIHGPAALGSNAGVQFPLPLGSPKVGVAGPYSAAQEADLFAGLHYVNVHSSQNPGGEIRGQIIMDVVPTQASSFSKVKALF